MNQHSETIADACSKFAYAVSGGIVFGDIIGVIDQHTWIIGAILGSATLICQIYFNLMHYRLKKQESEN